MKKEKVFIAAWPKKLAMGGWKVLGRSAAFAKEKGVETWDLISTSYALCRTCGYIPIGEKCPYCGRASESVVKMDVKK